jgi:hypothetical protein
LKPLISWLLAGILAACAVGWIAARIHASGLAPVGLTSFGIGALLGIIITTLAATQRVAGPRTLLFGTLLFACITIIAEHAWLYRDFRGQWQEARQTNAAVAMFRDEKPPSPSAYFAREWQPVLWISDAALIVVTSLCVVIFRRRPQPSDL